MNYFPLGEVKQDRYELSQRYKLVEVVNGIHRLTVKARKYYDEISYIKYLQGKLEKPIRLDATPEPVKNVQFEFKNKECQQLINEILSL